MTEDFKDVSGLLEEDVSKVCTDEKASVADKIDIGGKIDIGDKIEIVKPIPIKPIRAPKFAAMRTMAEYPIPKPVIRREIYQYCIAGGDMTDYTLPYPVTLEEKYLAKICGMDIDVPEPVKKYKTIEQGREVWYTTKLPDYYQYLYALCGFEWDVPYPVIRRDKYLYKNLGYEIETPEPVTREEIYWNGGQATPTTIEGIPPLTFTAKRTGNLEDYTIYGNSVQTGTPTPDSPIEPEFVGELVTEGEYAGQYMIPITSGGVTKTIYLGQTPTTRRIKKLVLTGEEYLNYDWNAFVIAVNDSKTAAASETITVVSNQYSSRMDMSAGSISGAPNNIITKRATYHILAIKDSRFTTAADFKSYLAQQYANGTPVTVWYVLATPDVGIVNEPLAKIGDYADSVNFSQAGVEIPTTAGENTISVGTTVQPSNMSITYK